MIKINTSLVKKVAIISSVSWLFVIPCFIGLLIGYYLDKFLKTSPIFIIIFIILGIITGGYEGIRLLIKMMNQKDEIPH